MANLSKGEIKRLLDSAERRAFGVERKRKDIQQLRTVLRRTRVVYIKQ